MMGPKTKKKKRPLPWIREVLIQIMVRGYGANMFLHTVRAEVTGDPGGCGRDAAS